MKSQDKSGGDIEICVGPVVWDEPTLGVRCSDCMCCLYVLGKKYCISTNRARVGVPAVLERRAP